MQLNTQELQIQNIGNTRLLYYPNQSYLTNIQILTQVGSAAEEKNQQGLAHILEHMFFKGSQKRPGGTAISRAANHIGAKMNAYTSYDHTVYHISVLNEVFSEGFDILADMYMNPLFPEEEFAKELNPILSELREREDDPESYLMERSFARYFGEIYHPIIGTEESIRSSTVEAMHSFKSKFYGGENCLISVVGGVGQNLVLEETEKFFKKTFQAEVHTPKKAQCRAGELSLQKAGIREAYYSLLFPALENTHPDRYKQDMMSYLLGGNDSALLFERIREELGMSCYGIYSWIMRNEPYSILGINCGIAKEELEQLHEEVMACIRRIYKEKLEEDRLQRAKAALRASVAARAETSAGMNSMLALAVLRGETENPVQSFLSRMERIELQDIQEIAEQTLLHGPMLKSTLLPL